MEETSQNLNSGAGPDGQESRPEGTGGSIVVVILLVCIAAGTAAWFSMDHGRDILSKDTGRNFAAAFEKQCQPNHPVDTCKAVAGEHHTPCLRGAASEAEGGIEYDQKAYLKCMRDALDSRAQ